MEMDRVRDPPVRSVVTQNSYKQKSLGSSNDSLNWPLDLSTICPVKYLPLCRGSRTEETRDRCTGTNAQHQDSLSFTD